MKRIDCHNCRGTGQMEDEAYQWDCEMCDGTGKIIAWACPHDQGWWIRKDGTGKTCRRCGYERRL